MTANQTGAGLEAAFLENRDKLLRFLRARGAGDAAEDLVQEVWLKIATAHTGPVAAPLAYLYRAANMVMIDRYRSASQAKKRDHDWSEAHGGEGGASPEPSPERAYAATQEAVRVLALLETLGSRVAHSFRRHRVDGIPQKAVAAELGVSLSTVEHDLRVAYRALHEWKERHDEA